MDTLSNRPSGSLADYFDARFAVEADPWRYRTSWYESRKRTLTLAALPHERYRRGFEPGCAIGELSAALAPRCDELLCADFAPHALAIARERLALYPHVRVQRRAMPDQWPSGCFDLIVVSEFAYYLDHASCVALAVRACMALEPHGALVCCHWRHGGEAWMLPCETVRDAFSRAAGRASLHRVVHLVDADFMLDVWSGDARGVAHREQCGCG
jgi:SAM-dependent methyltransferase